MQVKNGDKLFHITYTAVLVSYSRVEKKRKKSRVNKFLKVQCLFKALRLVEFFHWLKNLHKRYLIILEQRKPWSKFISVRILTAVIERDLRGKKLNWNNWKKVYQTQTVSSALNSCMNIRKTYVSKRQTFCELNQYQF